MASIWVYSSKPDAVEGLLHGAQALGATPAALVLHDRAQAEKLARLGSDVFLLAEGGAMAEDYVDTIHALIRQEKPAGLLLGTTVTDRAIAGRLAGRLGLTAQADVKSISHTDGTIQTTHLIYGGAAVLTNACQSEMFIALAAPGTFSPIPAGAPGVIREAAYQKPAWTITCTGSCPRKIAPTNLAAADRVVAVGLGLSDRKDLPMAEELAAQLGAELGCTRPIAVGLDWMPASRYIGISGTVIKPELYVAIGISGQVQHTIGCVDSKKIVVINKDENCAFAKNCDYALIGDLREIVPALTAKLKER